MSENQENSTIFTKREYNGKPPGRKRTAWRIVLYLLAACVLAGGVYIVLSLLPDPDTESVSESPLRTEVLRLQPEDVASITVQSETPFTLHAVIEETDAQSGSETEVTWQLQGADTAVLDLSSTESYAESLLAIDALRTMTGTEGDYGFPEDGAGITIQMRDGTSHTLQFGDLSLDQIGNYMLLDDTTVYVVDTSLADQMETTPTSFASRAVIESLSTETYAEYVIDGAIAGFDRLELTQKGGATTVITAKKVEDAFEYGMESPQSAAVAEEDIEPVLSILQTGLTADGLYGYGIVDPDDPGRTMTEAEFFAAAEYTVVLRLGDTQFELALSGKNADGNYALVCKGKNATYQVSASAVEEWTALAQ